MSDGPPPDTLASDGEASRDAAPPDAPGLGAIPDGSVLGSLRRRIILRLEREGRYPTWVLLAALAGMFATTFPITILTVSLGDIAREFETSETVMTWVISAPMLTSALSLPVMGKLGDLYGHRRVFLIGFGVATAIAAATALAWNPGSLIGFRTGAQVIGAATQPTSMALIMSVYAPAERVKATGWWTFVAAGAPTIGLVAGGPLVEAFGWRPVFVVQAVFAAVALGVAVLVLRETTRRERVRFDVAGAVTLTLATGGLMIILTQGIDWGWTNPVVIVSTVAAPLGLVAFVRAERRAPSPLLPLDFLARRNFSAPLVSELFAGGAYMGGFILAPLLLRFVFGYSIAAVAFIMVLRPLSFSLSSPVGGHVSTRLGERATAVLGTGVLTAALALFGLGASRVSIGIVGVALVLQGIGNGISRPPLAATLLNSVDHANFGVAAAAQRLTWQVGSAFGIAVLTVIYGGSNDPAAFTRAYLVGAGLAAVSFVAATFVRSHDRGEDDEERRRPEWATPAT